MKLSKRTVLASALATLALVATIISICQYPGVNKKGGPVLTLANAPVNGYSLIAIKVATHLNPGPPGAEQNWNFSSVINTTDRLDTGGYITVLNRSSKPGGNETTDSGLCLFGTRNTDTAYFYYVLNSFLFADTLTVFKNRENFVWPIVKPELKFPFHFGDTLIKQCQKSGQAAHNDTVIYDAYGDIWTPFGHYKDVIRLHYFDGKGEINYEWWTTKPFFSLMCYTPSGGIRFYIPAQNSN